MAERGKSDAAERVAYEVIRRVEQGGAYATLAQGGALDRHDLGPEARGVVTELVLGVLRHRTRLDRALASKAPRGLGSLSAGALTIMRVAAYQLLFMKLPAPLAVDHAVRAMRDLAGEGLSRFANAVLRKLADGGEPPPPPSLGERLTQLHSLPLAIATRLRAAVGDHDAEIAAEAFNRPPPVTLRVSLDRQERAALASELTQALGPRAEVTPSPLLPEALNLRGAGNPDRLEAFAEGRCTVQDAAAQLVARLVGPRPGERILDACAGVGGKSTHLAQLARVAGGQAQIDAADTSQRKLDLGRTAARRMGLSEITLHRVDLTRPGGLAGRYDRILLDAPCSGLGVLRRHPEAKWRSGDSVTELAGLQSQLLDAMAGLVAPGGVLVYSVCTFTAEEGPAQIASFLARHPDFALEAPPAQPGVDWAAVTGSTPGTIATWPHRHDTDAFFAARLVRARSG